MVRLTTPLTREKIKGLKAGQRVTLDGAVYTARDQAHKKLCSLLAKRGKLPFELKNQVIYYCGPARTPKGGVIGSCGPTTSRRMDAFTPELLKAGLSGMIGKGDRAVQVARAIKMYKGIYFLAYAGCGALLTKYVKSAQPVAFAELGPEAVTKLIVKDLPLFVAIDSRGNNIFRLKQK